MMKYSAAREGEATRHRCPLSPFPDGWYVVELSRNMRPGKLVGKQWMGRQIVTWRDSSGKVCVAEAYCPHMGAKLTPATGGRVYGDVLKCPFHGFEYDVSGKCVNTPNAPPPKTCSLKTYHVHESMGFVFAYWGNQSRIPDWTPPRLDDDGWSDIKVRRFTVRTHPQDFAENSVDTNHLKYVHNWDDGRQSLRAKIQGRYYTAGFSYTGSPNLPGFGHIRYEASPTVHVWGLGFVYTDSESKAYNVKVRNWFLPVPIDGDYIEAFVAIQLKKMSLPSHESRFHMFRKLGDWLGLKFAQQIILYETVKEFQKDIAIWNHRRYVESPALCSSDGELHKFRKYCRQFYTITAD